MFKQSRGMIKIISAAILMGLIAAACGNPAVTTAPTDTSSPAVNEISPATLTETSSPTLTETADGSDDIWIEITSPQEGASLNAGQPIHIEGTGQGLFEGNVIVDVTTESGDVLAQDPTILDAPDIGQEGTWQIDIPVDVQEDTQVVIRAYHESARDGSVVAQDQVSVTLTADSEVGDETTWIMIHVPEEGLTLDTSGPIHIEGTGAGLFENNVALRIESQDGESLAQASTTLDVMEMGQEGPWQIDMIVDVQESTPARIVAYHASARDGSIVAQDEVEVTLTPASEGAPLVDTSWILMAFSEGNSAAVRYSHTISMTFDSQEQTVSGQASCNQYSASYQVQDRELTIGDAESTVIGCEDETRMELEERFLNLLDFVTGYRVHDGMLYLTGQDGKVLMRFQEDPVVGSGYTRDQLGNSVYLHPSGGENTFQNGVFEEGTVEDGDRIWMVLLNHMIFGDFDQDGEEDAILVIASNMGGSGTFFELVSANSVGENLMSIDATAMLGDRIIINRLRPVENELVEVDMVVQGPDEPLCCPTRHIIARYELADSEWMLVNEEVIGE